MRKLNFSNVRCSVEIRIVKQVKEIVKHHQRRGKRGRRKRKSVVTDGFMNFN